MLFNLAATWSHSITLHSSICHLHEGWLINSGSIRLLQARNLEIATQLLHCDKCLTRMATFVRAGSSCDWLAVREGIDRA